MNNKYTKIAAIAGLGIALGICQAAASAIEITIGDRANGSVNKNIFNGGAASGWVNDTGINEDNETEKVPGLTAIASQAWDMEAFTLDGNILSIVTGYDMSLGVTHGNKTYKPGDLFIKVGGSAPDWGTNTAGAGNVTNGLFGTLGDPNGYSYAVDLSLSGGISTAGTTITNVYTLNNSSTLATSTNDQFLSNPWTYLSGATSTSSTGITYKVGLTSTQVASETGVSGLSALKGNNAVFNTNPDETYNAHNVLTVDLSFLGNIPNGSNVYFHYVMECGNDMLEGEVHVPDSGASFLLITMGLVAMSMAGLNRRRS